MTAELYASVESFRVLAYERQAAERLTEHLEQTYDVEVEAVSTLDAGVFRVDRRQAQPWVARLFTKARPVDAVEGDAEILEFLAVNDYPAERCIEDPVSVLEDQGLIVTEFVPGANCRGNRSPELYQRLGDLLGRLHSLGPGPAAASREAGSWHNLSVRGGLRHEDVAAMTSLLADAMTRAAPAQQQHMEALGVELERLDLGRGLPTALSHPDFSPANIILGPDGPVPVDWTGAGTAPRVGALAWLLATTGGDRLLLDAAVSGYGLHVCPTEEELTRLPDSVRAFGLILDCWYVVCQGASAGRVVNSLDAGRQLAVRISAQAREAFSR